METFKIIIYVLLAEAVIYYLFTCFHKWSSGTYGKDIFNPLISWREAEREKCWYEGYESHRSSVQGDLEGIRRNDKDLKLLSARTKELHEKIKQVQQAKEAEQRISAN